MTSKIQKLLTSRRSRKIALESVKYDVAFFIWISIVFFLAMSTGLVSNCIEAHFCDCANEKVKHECLITQRPSWLRGKYVSNCCYPSDILVVSKTRYDAIDLINGLSKFGNIAWALEFNGQERKSLLFANDDEIICHEGNFYLSFATGNADLRWHIRSRGFCPLLAWPVQTFFTDDKLFIGLLDGNDVSPWRWDIVGLSNDVKPISYSDSHTLPQCISNGTMSHLRINGFNEHLLNERTQKLSNCGKYAISEKDGKPFVNTSATMKKIQQFIDDLSKADGNYSCLFNRRYDPHYSIGFFRESLGTLDSTDSYRYTYPVFDGSAEYQVQGDSALVLMQTQDYQARVLAVDTWYCNVIWSAKESTRHFILHGPYSLPNKELFIYGCDHDSVTVRDRSTGKLHATYSSNAPLNWIVRGNRLYAMNKNYLVAVDL